MKLESKATYPVHKTANGIPTNMVLNQTPAGMFQIARVLRGGGADEADFEVLFEGTREDCENFWREQVRKGFPGLID